MKKANDNNKFRDMIYNTPKFEPWKWDKFKKAGCYPYALNVMINEFALVGDFIGKRCTGSTSDEVFIEVLKEELSTIFDFEVKQVKISTKPQKGERKIIVIRDNHTGYYHFFRVDRDRKISNKFPNRLPKRVSKALIMIELNSPYISRWCFLLKRRE